MDIKQQILAAFTFRHACKEFDPARKIAEEDFDVILEAGRLSPSSFGLEPWKFLIVQNMALREKIRPVCWGAQKQLPTASHYIVLLARKAIDTRYDAAYLKTTMAEVQKSTPEIIQGRIERIKNFQESDFLLTDERTLFDWACKQTYIALGNMLTIAALLGIDSCPIEGFNREKLERILIDEGILDDAHFGVACMAAFGYRAADPVRAKTRRNIDTVAEWINNKIHK
jgi:nitroreductase